MRKFIVLALVFVFVMAFATAAVAVSPDSWNGPGPTYRDPVVPPAPSPDSPHGSYNTTGDECEICHSPHQAGGQGLAAPDGTSYKLLRVNETENALACDYCHAAGGAAGAPYLVYLDESNADLKDGLAGGHEIADFGGSVPDDVGGTVNIGADLDCFDCHSVHGAATLDAAAFGGSANGLLAADLPTNAILKEDPGATIGGAAADMNEWCDSCHTDNYQTAVNGTSHYMGAYDVAGSTKNLTELATQSSENCISCHNADGTADTYIWPHNSRGEGMMEWESAPGVAVTRDTMDANCLACHDGIIGTTF